MPIYEYQCQKCQHSFEVLQKMSESPPDKCPLCGVARVKKLISKVGFQLKGTGWYETDFKNKGSMKNENKSEKASSNKDNSKPKSEKKENKKTKSDVK